MDIRGSALTEEEKTGFSIVQAAQDERRLCLMRTVLDGRERAAICSVFSGEDGILTIVPHAVVITDDEAARILDPDGRPTAVQALADLLETSDGR